MEKGVPAELRLLQGAVHLFDIYPNFEEQEEAVRAIDDGYCFLAEYVQS